MRMPFLHVVDGDHQVDHRAVPLVVVILLGLHGGPIGEHEFGLRKGFDEIGNSL